LVKDVESHPNIVLHLGADITNVAGFIGQFKVSLFQDGTYSEVSCGAIIVATGAAPAATREYLHGSDAGIITQLELEQRLHKGNLVLGQKNVVMIQCVGSRNDERPYCSRICCSMAVKNALKIKKQNPSAGVYVLYRDIRTYGFREKYYKQARKAGVIFIRYERDAPPVVSRHNGLIVGLTSRISPRRSR
jgi:heterodisulfide reductase subunit A